MDKRYKDVRQLFDFATALADELLEEHPDYSAHDIFTLAGEIALHNLNELNTPSVLPVGTVDNTRVAFMLQDGDSAALIAGDFEFAQNTGKTVFAHDGETEFEENEDEEE